MGGKQSKSIKKLSKPDVVESQRIFLCEGCYDKGDYFNKSCPLCNSIGLEVCFYPFTESLAKKDNSNNALAFHDSLESLLGNLSCCGILQQNEDENNNNNTIAERNIAPSITKDDLLLPDLIDRYTLLSNQSAAVNSNVLSKESESSKETTEIINEASSNVFTKSNAELFNNNKINSDVFYREETVKSTTKTKLLTKTNNVMLNTDNAVVNVQQMFNDEQEKCNVKPMITKSDSNYDLSLNIGVNNDNNNNDNDKLMTPQESITIHMHSRDTFEELSLNNLNLLKEHLKVDAATSLSETVIKTVSNNTSAVIKVDNQQQATISSSSSAFIFGNTCSFFAENKSVNDEKPAVKVNTLDCEGISQKIGICKDVFYKDINNKNVEITKIQQNELGFIQANDTTYSSAKFTDDNDLKKKRLYKEAIGDYKTESIDKLITLNKVDSFSKVNKMNQNPLVMVNVVTVQSSESNENRKELIRRKSVTSCSTVNDYYITALFNVLEITEDIVDELLPYFSVKVMNELERVGNTRLSNMLTVLIRDLRITKYILELIKNYGDQFDIFNDGYLDELRTLLVKLKFGIYEVEKEIAINRRECGDDIGHRLKCEFNHIFDSIIPIITKSLSTLSLSS